MSVGYQPVQWSRHKRVYDAVVLAVIVAYIGTFVAIGSLAWRGVEAISFPILLMRALGSCAIVLLHAILCIGPLARLDRRFLPVLYNRRHLGVMTFLVALAHATVAIVYYHAFGVVSPLLSLLGINQNFTSLHAFPFQLLGVLALCVMFVMAATSHDFWLRNLGAAAWKRIHMLVYPAYALLVGHVALGALQTDRGILAPITLIAGAALVTALHLVAGSREAKHDRPAPAPDTATDTDWLDVGPPDDIPDNRARTVCAPGGERIAVFKHNNSISAVTNVCAHQGGPLGEGKVIDGCITCPWHGWQYKPTDGRSPPPFTEKITTYRVRILAGRVQVNRTALPAGTPVEPAQIPATTSSTETTPLAPLNPAHNRPLT
jgi:nitrite reductase/ring-hydroxylating ferredoxin subunit/DMSO/TMAO reductase YedYZ heme-binding membrane subunit